MKEARIDWDRASRTGIPEAIYCAGKSAPQIDAILAEAADRAMLLTRLSAAKVGELASKLDYDPQSETGVFGVAPKPVDMGAAIVAAGTSDARVAREAARTLEFAGVSGPLTIDVGVAGLWRLTEAAARLQDRRVIIACAGFEGALFSVLAGLVKAPIIAVPTSVGEGVAAGGQAALSSALASCAPGVATVNIDNGFGAACMALKILNAGEAQ
ncbi:MAG: nickel pincer cofactor biosynthesis protein LarB [Pseudomonadota bacterium]